MKIKISDKLSFPKLFLFALPSIIMMIFCASYTIVDAIFVANLVSTDALSALNIAYPVTSLMFAIGIMFGSGGSALVAKLLGEGKEEEGRKAFTLILVSGFIITTIISIIFLSCMDPLLWAMGADNDTFLYTKEYLTIILLTAPFAVLQMIYQSFFIVISKPTTGLILNISSGLANILFDWFFISLCDLGIKGAAFGTAIGFFITAIGGLIIFSVRKEGLRHSKFNFNWSYLYKSMLNGSSEMVVNLATSIMTLIFNITMHKLVGSKGIAAITAIMYFQFLMQAFIIGYSNGVAPVFSFHYGEKNVSYLKTIRNKSLIFIAISSVIITIIAYLLTVPLNLMFSRGDEELYNLIMRGNLIFSICYLFAGFNIYLSSLFTALNDGITSAIIAFCRTFLFIVTLTPLFAKFLGTDGVFLVIPAAEFLTFIIAFSLFKYSYNKDIKKLDLVNNKIN